MPTVHLTGERATLLATLYGRALDAASPATILHDTMALEAVRQIDFDFTKIGLRRGDPTAVALRASHLDGWSSEFLTTHPKATVLHLGCGLETRVYRLNPGPGVRWFDVDYPDVIVSWGIDSCADLEAIDPRLRCVTSLNTFDLDGFHKLPTRYHVMVTMAKLFPAMKRAAALYRLEFSQASLPGHPLRSSQTQPTAPLTPT